MSPFWRAALGLPDPPIKADTVIGGGHVRMTPLEKLRRDVRRFSLAAQQATTPEKRARHLANLKRSKLLLEAAEMEVR